MSADRPNLDGTDHDELTPVEDDYSLAISRLREALQVDISTLKTQAELIDYLGATLWSVHTLMLAHGERPPFSTSSTFQSATVKFEDDIDYFRGTASQDEASFNSLSMESGPQVERARMGVRLYIHPDEKRVSFAEHGPFVAELWRANDSEHFNGIYFMGTGEDDEYVPHAARAIGILVRDFSRHPDIQRALGINKPEEVEFEPGVLV